jgi:hypothetical protein
MAIRVLNKHRDEVGGAEYIGRGSPLGNPFRLERGAGEAERAAVVARYEAWLQEKIAARDLEVCEEMNRLFRIARNGDLAIWCYCAPQRCHGDIVRSILEDKLLNRTSGSAKVPRTD